VVSRNDLHVTTDLVDRFLAARVRRALDVAVQLLCALVLFGAAWLVWLKAGRTARLGDVTAALHLTLAPYVYLMCALLLVAAVIHLVKAFLPGAARAGTGSV
jgi:TRAP-type C4-dicarboxylate transport system permease small subunit